MENKNKSDLNQCAELHEKSATHSPEINSACSEWTRLHGRLLAMVVSCRRELSRTAGELGEAAQALGDEDALGELLVDLRREVCGAREFAASVAEVMTATFAARERAALASLGPASTLLGDGKVTGGDEAPDGRPTREAVRS